MPQAKLYVQNSMVIHVGEWEYQYRQETSESEQVLLNPIPPDAQVIETGNYTFDERGQVILA